MSTLAPGRHRTGGSTTTAVRVDHVAFGPDVLYGDHRGLLAVLGDQYDVDVSEEIDGRRHVRGLENPTEAWHNLVRYLVAEGYEDEEVRKVLGKNVLRVLGEVW